MPLIDQQTLTRRHSLKVIFEHLKEARLFYETNFGFPETIPADLLFEKRLTNALTERIAILLKILGLTENERFLFWIAKFYFCLPLPNGWRIRRDSVETEIFVYEDQTSCFHPSIFYVISLFSHHLNKMANSSYLVWTPFQKKNEFHFCKKSSSKKENEKIGKKDSFAQIIIRENIFCEFQRLEKEFNEKLAGNNWQFFIFMLNRNPNYQREEKKALNLFFQTNENKKIIQPQNLLKLKNVTNNFMNVETNYNFPKNFNKNHKLETGNFTNRFSIKPVEKINLFEIKSQQKAEIVIPKIISKMTKNTIESFRKERILKIGERDINDSKNENVKILKNSDFRAKSDFFIRNLTKANATRDFFYEMGIKSRNNGLVIPNMWKTFNQTLPVKENSITKTEGLFQTGGRLLSFKIS